MSDDATPAPKADLQALKVDLRNEITSAKEELRRDLASFKEEMKRHFDVVAEELRHDVLGALKDGISLFKEVRDDHERRIQRLEHAAGLAPRA